MMKVGDEKILREHIYRVMCDKCKKEKIGTIEVGKHEIYVAGYENQLNREVRIRWCIECVLVAGR